MALAVWGRARRRRGVPHQGTERATPHYPKGAKKQITLRIDPDVLAWFKAHGRGYQTRMNAALRAFVEAHRQGDGRRS